MTKPSTNPSRPVLYSFRRCPYAMRARLAIKAAGFSCELREIVLRDKAPELLAVSPRGTVPVLVLSEGRVLEESLEIMLYVLRQHDPFGWLPPAGQLAKVLALIAENDGPFKAHLDRTKYGSRFVRKGEVVDEQYEREAAMTFIKKLEDRLAAQKFLFGDQAGLADMAILPFVRQFAHIDRDWFQAQPVSHVQRWLEDFLNSVLFQAIMHKYDRWQAGQKAVLFPLLGEQTEKQEGFLP